MVSVLKNVKATMGWRKHQLLADFDENESPVPDKFKRKASLSSLNTIRMSLRKRIPLKQVELNFHETPTWESMEARAKCQTLRSITRTARNAFGTVSQKIQKTHQNPIQSIVAFPDESVGRRSHVTSSSKKRSTMPQTPCHNKNSVTPAASSMSTPGSSKRALLGPTRVSEHREWRGFPSWHGEDALPLRRSRRAAALKSPYSSPACASRMTEFECELELVSSGIRRLKHLSQALDDGIEQEEREHAISIYYCLMAQNLQSVHRSQKFSQAIRRQAKKLLSSLYLDRDGYK
ncbi:protein PIMREG isoform X1 [Anas acuta]|uniref:PICALM interacting mitotic regulator n=1 Tax=Anas platyrhynchos platyrhynchos TaxID=8840 RepID=U3IHA2_ANAPP|nr:protein PIMREG isoform X1 [Anas platyrhynchos]XP_027328377.1 protein PIMREG isoform X1 [Anas platyrhynchos]|eukprot:XP_027328376.1 protein PIMREG isoform X1 [Anas platyrhynchos]